MPADAAVFYLFEFCELRGASGALCGANQPNGPLLYPTHTPQPSPTSLKAGVPCDL